MKSNDWHKDYIKSLKEVLRASKHKSIARVLREREANRQHFSCSNRTVYRHLKKVRI